MFIKILKSIAIFIGAIIPFVETNNSWIKNIANTWKEKK